MAGCSANVTRFDEPAFGLTDSDSPTGGRASGAGFEPIFPTSAAQAPSSSANSPPIAYAPPASRASDRIETAALPQVSRPPAMPPRVYNRPPERAEPRDTFQPPRDESASPEYDRGRDTVTVVSGDTLYGLARRHDVSVNALMSANGLTSTMLRPGQVLKLPAGVVARPSSAATITAPPSRPNFTEEAAPPTWGGRYEVVSGDSLYTIARRFSVQVADLRRYNGIADPRRLRPGHVLKVPGGASYGTAADARGSSREREALTTGPGRFEEFRPGQRRIIAAPKAIATDAPADASQPAILNSRERRVAALDAGSGGSAFDNAPGANSVRTLEITKPSKSADEAGELRWPVTGPIISRFGPRSDGTHNDGVNVAVPVGTDVLAAEDGVVAYAGSELKGYGKLILVRHDNGWVTAYAHNSELLVKRGDQVKRGQTIAKSGSTGEVDTPQVHFELRQGAKPVDPVPYLKRT